VKSAKQIWQIFKCLATLLSELWYSPLSIVAIAAIWRNELKGNVIFWQSKDSNCFVRTFYWSKMKVNCIRSSIVEWTETDTLNFKSLKMGVVAWALFLWIQLWSALCVTSVWIKIRSLATFCNDHLSFCRLPRKSTKKPDSFLLFMRSFCLVIVMLRLSRFA
jgi:hypothetical protein